MKHALTAIVLIAATALAGCAAESGTPEEGVDQQTDDVTASAEVVDQNGDSDSLIRRIADSNGDSHVEVMAGPQPVPWHESGPQPVPWTPPTSPEPDPRGDSKTLH